MSSVADIAMEFLGRGGKRLRPRLCQAVFTAAGGHPEAGDLSSLLEAIECFHKASLIHDDIQDSDEVRYGRPSVWKEHGVAVAIAVGDWLVARGYTLIAESGFRDVAGMLRSAVRSHLTLCEGQGDELTSGLALSAAERISIYERKTGEAFALAAELGALAAGADPAKYRRYALAFGVLFQINDDLADGDVPEGLAGFKDEYEAKTSLYRDECALGVW